MCCFSVTTPVGLLARLFQRPVHVSATNIFARMISPGVQGLAYGMDLETRHPVAMVLPLPVAPGSGEDAVTFVDLSKDPQMFSDLSALFTMMQPAAAKGGFSLPSRGPSRLVVHKVGAFVASYVPTRADFSRLDPRFRLPDVLFDAVPHYADHGFAVFQLEPGKVTVHPMALRFPTRDPERLFFPTVHVHDGRFHATAKFDHALYYQTLRRSLTGPTFAPLDGDPVGWGTPRKSYEGLIEPDHAVIRRTLRGRLANQDTWLAA
jgi:hypothetical protein